jgi:hypothetical protein
MTRRTIGFLVTLALSLLVVPPASQAQQPTKIPRIGVLVPGPLPRARPLRHSVKSSAGSAMWKART